MRNEKYFYVLEGTCCSGKTTVIDLVKGKGYEIIKENVEICDDFPPLPTNYNESRRNERFCLNLEKKKSIIAQASSSPFIFADRMLVSTLSISYAWDYGSIKDFVQDIVSCMRNEGELFTCDCNIYLKTSEEIIAKRNVLRSNTLGECWVSPEVLKRQKHFYNVYMNTVKTDNWYIINTDYISPEEIMEEILKVRIKKQQIDTEQRVNEFGRLLKEL